jgi:hypothetical protein
MLRLRAGIGVGAKADLLAVLLGLDGAAAEMKTITLAAGYSDRAMRTAAEEMARARFIQEVEGPPTSYRADREAWGGVLDFHPEDTRRAAGYDMPRWRFWSVAFSFLTAVIEWERKAHQEEWSGYVASSRARDLMEMHRRRLRQTAVVVTDGRDAPGAAYLASFRTIVEEVSTWARLSL